MARILTVLLLLLLLLLRLQLILLLPLLLLLLLFTDFRRINLFCKCCSQCLTTGCRLNVSMVVGALVANKADFVERRVVSPKNGERFAQQVGLEYFETSAVSFNQHVD